MSYRRMPSLPIVICFDVLKDTGLGLAPSAVPFAMDEFDFQCAKEAFRDGVIVAVGDVARTAA